MRNTDERMSEGFHNFYLEQFDKHKYIRLDDPNVRERVSDSIMDMLLFEHPIIRVDITLDKDTYEKIDSRITPRPNMEEMAARQRRRDYDRFSGKPENPTPKDDPMNDYYHRLLVEGPSARETNPEGLTPKQRVRVEKLYNSRRDPAPTTRRPLYDLD